MNFNQVAKEYFEGKERVDSIDKMTAEEEVAMLESGDFDLFCQYSKEHPLTDETEMKLFELDLKYLDKYIEEYSLCGEAQLKLFELDPKYLEKYLKKRWVCYEAEEKLKEYL